MTLNTTRTLVATLLSISFILIGISFLLGANPKTIDTHLAFYGLEGFITTIHFSRWAGTCFVLFPVALWFAKSARISPVIPVAMALLLSVLPLLTLLSPEPWVASLGGFPVIGSGQGIIKYAAVMPLVIFLFFHHRFTARSIMWANYLPVAMVLLWIGAMKFYAFEANAIVPLIETSPLMSWLYRLFSVQMASNLIGSFDILFALLLALGLVIKSRSLVMLSGIACLSVFLMTQTFLFSAPNALSPDTLLNRLGQFVVKDLWFIANLAVLHFYSRQRTKPGEKLT